MIRFALLCFLGGSLLSACTDSSRISSGNASSPAKKGIDVQVVSVETKAFFVKSEVFLSDSCEHLSQDVINKFKNFNITLSSKKISSLGSQCQMSFEYQKSTSESAIPKQDRFRVYSKGGMTSITDEGMLNLANGLYPSEKTCLKELPQVVAGYTKAMKEKPFAAFCEPASGGFAYALEWFTDSWVGVYHESFYGGYTEAQKRNLLQAIEARGFQVIYVFDQDVNYTAIEYINPSQSQNEYLSLLTSWSAPFEDSTKCEEFQKMLTQVAPLKQLVWSGCLPFKNQSVLKVWTDLQFGDELWMVNEWAGSPAPTYKSRPECEAHLQTNLQALTTSHFKLLGGGCSLKSSNQTNQDEYAAEAILLM